MGIALLVVTCVWLAGEIALQVSEWVRAAPAQREWRSVAGIVAACVIGSVLSGPICAALPPVHLAPVPAGIVGLALSVPGLALRVWSVATLGRFFRPIVSIASDQQVVRSGPYRLVRHPSYTGLLMIILGLTLAGGNVVSALVVFLGVLGGVLWRIRAEERVLHRAFGAAWESHAAATGRLWPRIRRSGVSGVAPQTSSVSDATPLTRRN